MGVACLSRPAMGAIQVLLALLFALFQSLKPQSIVNLLGVYLFNFIGLELKLRVCDSLFSKMSLA